MSIAVTCAFGTYFAAHTARMPLPVPTSAIWIVGFVSLGSLLHVIEQCDDQELGLRPRESEHPALTSKSSE